MKSKILGLALLFSAACTNVGPNEIGILVDKCNGGGVQVKPLETGYRYVSPFCEDVIEFPTKVYNLVFSESTHEGDKRNTELHIPSKEGMDLKLDVALAYRIDPPKGPAFYKKWKTTADNLPQFENSFLLNIIREKLREEVVKYPVEEIYTNQEKIRGLVQQSLAKHLYEEGLVVENFSISGLRLPDSVRQQVEAKVAATQAAQTAENKVRQIKAQALQAVAEAEGQAAAALTKAEGEAKAKKLKADAEAYYVKTVTSALTKDFVDYTKAQRWDGKLPHINGASGGMILQLKE